MKKKITIVDKDLNQLVVCLLYTSDAADDLLCVNLWGRRILKKKKQVYTTKKNKKTTSIMKTHDHNIYQLISHSYNRR